MKKLNLVGAIGLSVVMLTGITSMVSAAPAQDLLNTSFETPATTGTYWGAIDGWYVYDRYGIGATTGVMNAGSLATNGTQVGMAREGALIQHWILSNGNWPGTVEGMRYTFSADLGIDTVSPTQGLRPRTGARLVIHGTPDGSLYQDLAVLNLDLSNLTPGTMQRFSVSMDCLAANANVGWTTYIVFDQTEANSLTLIDNVSYDISPIPSVPEPASLISLGLGLVGLASAARRRKF